MFILYDILGQEASELQHIVESKVPAREKKTKNA